MTATLNTPWQSGAPDADRATRSTFTLRIRAQALLSRRHLSLHPRLHQIPAQPSGHPRHRRSPHLELSPHLRPLQGRMPLKSLEDPDCCPSFEEAFCFSRGDSQPGEFAPMGWASIPTGIQLGPAVADPSITPATLNCRRQVKSRVCQLRRSQCNINRFTSDTPYQFGARENSA